MEKTFIMVKNDGVEKKVIGECIKRFENKGLHLVDLKVMIPTMDILEKHYAEHIAKPWFSKMAENICSSQVIPMVWEGNNAVALAREIIGATNPKDAAPGTIRADFGKTLDDNVIHGSDSIESANREISIWFTNELPKIKYFE